MQPIVYQTNIDYITNIDNITNVGNKVKNIILFVLIQDKEFYFYKYS